MGLNAGDPSDQLALAFDNPQGHFELESVVDLNTELLEHLGGSWDSPPVQPDGWINDAQMGTYVSRARDLVTSSLGNDQFVLKDPRIALLLPFWRRALIDHCCAVMIFRDPSEVAWSLHLRDGLPILTGLALWGAYNRNAMVDLEGLPVHICRYEDLVVNPSTVLASIAKSLGEWGQLGGDIDIESASATIKPDLQHRSWPRTNQELSNIPDSLASLNKHLSEQLGNHACFEPSPPPDTGWWEGPLLEERRIAGVRLQQLQASSAALEKAQSEQLRLKRRLRDLERRPPVRLYRVIERLVRRRD